MTHNLIPTDPATASGGTALTESRDLSRIVAEYLSNFLSDRTREAYEADFKDFGNSSPRNSAGFPTRATSPKPTSSRTGIFCGRNIPRPVSIGRCRLSPRFLANFKARESSTSTRRRGEAPAIDSNAAAAWVFRRRSEPDPRLLRFRDYPGPQYESDSVISPFYRLPHLRSARGSCLRHRGSGECESRLPSR